MKRYAKRTIEFYLYWIKAKLPTELTTTEIKALLTRVNANHLLQCQLMYGSGLRLMEVTRLRIQDIDFSYLSINIWNSKGGKHRCVTLAKELVPALKMLYITPFLCYLFTTARS